MILVKPEVGLELQAKYAERVGEWRMERSTRIVHRKICEEDLMQQTLSK
jgi:hypothetical protein